jgi:hypothetical protein
MSSQNPVGANVNRPKWTKPSVELVATVDDVRAGAVSRTSEDPFYNPS